LLLWCLERSTLRAISQPKHHQHNEYCCWLVRLPTTCYNIVKNFSNFLRAIYFQRRSLGRNAPLNGSETSTLGKILIWFGKDLPQFNVGGGGWAGFWTMPL
jgi:hypothetical protein